MHGGATLWQWEWILVVDPAEFAHEATPIQLGAVAFNRADTLLSGQDQFLQVTEIKGW